MAIVDASKTETGKAENSTPTLSSWVVEKVKDWEDHRNNNYSKRWAEYYRLWRGEWSEEDRTRQVERSKLIAPALQQAIEASVAEMQESIFHRRRWFDLEDDVVEKELDRAIVKAKQNGQDRAGAEQAAELVTKDMEKISNQLLEDFDLAGINEAISEIILNGALYGTGLGKIVIEQSTDKIMSPEGLTDKAVLKVGLVAVDPNEFVIDPAALKIESALGCAHVHYVPRHEILQKQVRGVYRDGFIGINDSSTIKGLSATGGKQIDRVEVIEYHGLVPKRMFEEADTAVTDAKDPLAFLNAAARQNEAKADDAAEMVECIVWIANRSTLLRISRNPFTMQDRSFVAFQYDTVPNRFWGRGIAEKGYNPQKALDAELRARVDSLALSTYPMLLINGAMAPRNQDYQVRPGRNIMVTGNVNEAIGTFKFPGPDQNSFRQSAELERMITVATGSLDTAAPLGVNPRNETASGISMMLGAMLKRAKRTLRNIEKQFLEPLVHKVAWRYMQFDPARYPQVDYKFKVHGALGAQAREFEVAQLTQMLQSQEPGTPGYWMLMKSILGNYNMEDKEDFMDMIEQYLIRALNPQPQEPAPADAAKLKLADLREKELDFKIKQAVETELRKDSEAEAEAIRDRGEAIWNMSEAVLNARKGEVEYVKAVAALMSALATAAGKDGANPGALLKKAQAMVDASIEESEDSPESEGLRASITRQVHEEQDVGLTVRGGQ